MPYYEGVFPVPGRPVTMTDGRKTVTFDSPAAFQDWLAEEHGSGADLSAWEWLDGVVVSDN
jgi:hypothetical protein